MIEKKKTFGPTDNYNEDTDFKLMEKVDHTSVLFHMIERINKAAFTGDDFSFFRGIDTLESNIPFEWEDEEYKIEIKGIRKKIERKVAYNNIGNEEASYTSAQLKMRAIMNLLERRGLFGEISGEEII